MSQEIYSISQDNFGFFFVDGWQVLPGIVLPEFLKSVEVLFYPGNFRLQEFCGSREGDSFGDGNFDSLISFDSY